MSNVNPLRVKRYWGILKERELTGLKNNKGVLFYANAAL